MTLAMDRRPAPEGDSAALCREAHHHAAGRGRPTTRILGALLTIMLSVSALAACAPTQPSANGGKAPTPTTAATAAPRLVYQADWSHGLAGWKGTMGWSASGGIVRSDMGANRRLTSPFQPTTPNYAVEFRLQLVTASTTDATQYAFSADSATGADGYIALFDNISFSDKRLYPQHPHESIYIDPLIHQEDRGAFTLQIHDFEPGIIWRTYRIEVRGTKAVLLIDSRIASWARTTQGTQLSKGALRFYSTGVVLKLSDFKVYAL